MILAAELEKLGQNVPHRADAYLKLDIEFADLKRRWEAERRKQAAGKAGFEVRIPQ